MYFPRCRHSIFKGVTMIVPQPRIWPLFRGVSSTFSAIFTPILHKTGTNWPLRNTPIFRIPSTLLLKHPYFRNFKYTFTDRVKNRKLQTRTPRTRRKKTPLFSISSTSSKTPFFRFRVQAHENNPFFQNCEHFHVREHACFKKRPLFTRNLERSCVHEVNTEWQHRGIFISFVLIRCQPDTFRFSLIVWQNDLPFQVTTGL